MPLDEASFRIFDTLSGSIGSTISMRELTGKIRQFYGTGYYARIYNKLNDLSGQGLITLTKAGRSSIPSLNFSNYSLLSFLAEIDLRKTREFLERYKTFQLLLMDAQTYAHGNSQIESISMINPDRNARLNRAEWLIILHHMDPRQLADELISIQSALRNIASTRLIRIDPLLLTESEFSDLLTSADINPLKEMLSNRTTFYNPISFWLNIGEVLLKSGRIMFAEKETNPAKLSDIDIAYGLSRFGYREMGIEPREGRAICIEYLIAALLLHGSARRLDAIPILLSKNKVNYSLLIFLSKKYEESSRLLGLIKALDTIRSSPQTETAIRLLQSLAVEEVKADSSRIEEKMELYGAIR